MHIGKMTVNSPEFRNQVWQKLRNLEVVGIAIAKDVEDEAEIRLYGARKFMVMSPQFYRMMLNDAEKKFHMGSYGTGYAILGIPVYVAETVEEFTRIGKITKSSHELNANWRQ